jgi:hypothetical protein
LLGRYREIERGRHGRLRELRELLDESPRLRPQLTAADAIDVVWSLSGPDQYIQLVFERRWSPARYEAWLGEALRALIVRPTRLRGASQEPVGADDSSRAPQHRAIRSRARRHPWPD